MTNTQIAQLGARILYAYGMPTHVTVLPLAWSPLIDKMVAQYQEARRIADLWREEYAEAVWSVPTREVEEI